VSAKRTCAGTVAGAKNPGLGNPCRRWAVNGSDYCAVHGGAVVNPSDLSNRCSAKSTRSGEQCKKPAIKGGTVCRTHGGSAAQVVKRARERLQELSEPAIVQLNRILQAQGTSDSDRLRAIAMVLDRTGFGPGMTVEHEVKPWEVTMQHVFTDAPSMQVNRTPPPELQAEAEKLPEKYRGFDPEELIEDAEIIEDEDDLPDNVTYVVPAYSARDRAKVRGSAEPPRRKR
jgi:hypothetical protein